MLNEIIKFCHRNPPRNQYEKMRLVDLYREIRDAFSKTNIHVPIQKINKENPEAIGLGSALGSGEIAGQVMCASPVYYSNQSTNTAPFNSSNS